MEVKEGMLVQAPGGQGKGTVRFVGNTKFRDGIWVGLELESPAGKNNGEVQGVKYFSCEENHGLFIRLQDIPKQNILSTSSTKLSPGSIHDLIPLEPESNNDDSGLSAPSNPDPGLSPISSTTPTKTLPKTKTKSNKTPTKSFERAKYEARIEELEEAMEMVSLDKEIAEALVEDLERQLAETIRSEQRYREIAEATTIAVSQRDYKEVLAQNNDLKMALEKLSEVSVSELKEFEKTKYNLEEANQEAEIMKQMLEEQAKQIEDMEQSVDDASIAQQVVDQLTEKCMKLEEEVTELKSTVEDSIVLRELSEEVESHHVDVERILHSQIEEMETAAHAQEQKILTMHDRLKDATHTIEQFRALVKAQRDELGKKEQKEGELAEQAASLMAESRLLMDKNLQLQSQTARMRASAIEAELLKLDHSQAKEHLEILLSMIPPPLISSYLASFHLILLLKRISSKCTLITTTLRRETGMSAEDACAIAGDAWVRTGFSTVLRVEFMAKLGLFYLDHCGLEEYVQAGHSVGEIVVAERALDSCVGVLASRNDSPTLEKFESQCSLALHDGAGRMESALMTYFQLHVLEEITEKDDAKVEREHGSPLPRIIKLHTQIMFVYLTTTYTLSISSREDVMLEVDPSTELSTLQGVWAKVLKSMEMGMQGKEDLEKVGNFCAEGKVILERLSSEGSGPWLESEVRSLYKHVAAITDDHSRKVPPNQDNRKKSIGIIRNSLNEAAGVARKLEDALEKQKELQKALVASQATVDESERALREKREEVIYNAKLAEDQLAKEVTNYATRVIAFEEQIETLRQLVDITNEDLTKSKTRTQYLEGKVRDLMEISGKQKKQLTQLLLGSSPSDSLAAPILSDTDNTVYTEALSHLQNRCAKLKADFAATTMSRLPPLTNKADAATALAHFALLPPLPSHDVPSPPDVHLPPAMNAWLRTTTHELASVRVVDLTLRSHDAAVRTQNARMRDLREEGRRLRGRVCMSMAPSLFRELNPMGGFVPPHITKVANDNKAVHLATITIPNQSPSQTHSTHVSFEQWQNIHNTFCKP